MEIFNDLEKFRSNQRRSSGFASLFHLFYYICSKFYDYLSLAKKKKKNTGETGIEGGRGIDEGEGSNFGKDNIKVGRGVGRDWKS